MEHLYRLATGLGLLYTILALIAAVVALAVYVHPLAAVALVVVVAAYVVGLLVRQ